MSMQWQSIAYYEHIVKIAEMFGLENFGTIVIFAYFS